MRSLCLLVLLVPLVLQVLLILLVLLVLGPLVFFLWAGSCAIANRNQQNLQDQKTPWASGCLQLAQARSDRNAERIQGRSAGPGHGGPTGLRNAARALFPVRAMCVRTYRQQPNTCSRPQLQGAPACPPKPAAMPSPRGAGRLLNLPQCKATCTAPAGRHG